MPSSIFNFDEDERMKVFFKKIGLFAFIFLILLAPLNQWMGKEYYPHYPLQYGEVFHPKVNASVVILGASQATHGINPKYLETDQLKIFNFALNGASPEFNLRWYQKIFRHYYPKPRYLIYAVHWGMFDDQILKRKLDQDSRYFPHAFLVKEFKNYENIKGLLFNRFAFIRERKRFLLRLFKKTSREVFLLSEYYNGFIPYETERALGQEDTVYPKMNPNQIQAFLELLNELERDQVKIIFIQVPRYHPGYDYDKISNHIRFLKEIAKKRDIPFFDYDTERASAINYESRFFSDPSHLNKTGSDAFSKLLKKDLEGFFI